uniref:Phospholipase A(2) n=1 Tax=Rhabditophanes sp. KR3021 TaxID=114890 RepID=A0AC35U312_9BILA
MKHNFLFIAFVLCCEVNSIPTNYSITVNGILTNHSKHVETISTRLADGHPYMCGAGPVSSWLSKVASSKCGNNDLNECCLKHDECYDSFINSQDECDQIFCDCIDNHYENFCKMWLKVTHCAVVKATGYFPFINARKVHTKVIEFELPEDYQDDDNNTHVYDPIPIEHSSYYTQSFGTNLINHTESKDAIINSTNDLLPISAMNLTGLSSINATEDELSSISAADRTQLSSANATNVSSAKSLSAIHSTNITNNELLPLTKIGTSLITQITDDALQGLKASNWIVNDLLQTTKIDEQILIDAKSAQKTILNTTLMQNTPSIQNITTPQFHLTIPEETLLPSSS